MRSSAPEGGEDPSARWFAESRCRRHRGQGKAIAWLIGRGTNRAGAADSNVSKPQRLGKHPGERRQMASRAELDGFSW